MAVIQSDAIVLSAIRYSETSKIVRLATRDHGVISAIAKGASRPKSRFGGALNSLRDDGYLADATADRIALTREGLMRVDVLLPRFFLPEHAGIRYT